MYDPDCVRFPQMSASKVSSTFAETENYSVLKPKEQKEAKEAKQGAMKKGTRDLDNMSQSNSSCKCVIF